MINSAPIFTTTGSKTAPAGCALVILGFTVALTLLIISFIAPDKVGAWWIWTAILLAIIAWGIYQNKKDNVTIELYKTGSNDLVVRLKGPTTNLEVPFRAEQMTYWYAHHHMSVKHGGGTLVMYFVAIPLQNGGFLGFKEMIGAKGSEPVDWKFNNQVIEEAEGVYHNHNIIAFVKAARNA